MRRWLLAPLMLSLFALANCAPYPPPGYHVAPTPGVRAFHIYFAFGRVDLTDRDLAALADAAAYANARPGTLIRIIGHADAPGAPAGNEAISRRRTEVVADVLTRHQVARERMSLEAYGANLPAVVTTPGGMQPENRRVDILIH